MTHEVRVLCRCNDVESCAMERYVSDVRILRDAYERVIADQERQSPILKWLVWRWQRLVA